MSAEREKIHHVVSEAKHRASDKLGDIWWWFMVRGILALGLAIAALFWPQQTIRLLINLLGAYFLFDGIVGVIGAFRAGARDGFPLFALVSLVAGATLLFWTNVSIKVFLTLVGIWALLQGLGMFLSSRNSDSSEESRQLCKIVGVVLAVAGLILVVWPGTGVVAISWLISAIALVYGCVLIFVATRLRRIKHRLSDAT